MKINGESLRTDNEGVGSILGGSVFGIPMVIVVIGVVAILFLLLGGWILIAFTTKTVIVVALVGVGLFLLIKKGAASALGQYGVWIALSLVLVGVLFYAGIFNGLFGG